MKSFRYLSALFVLIPAVSFATPLTYQQLQNQLSAAQYSAKVAWQLALLNNRESQYKDSQIKDLRDQIKTDEMLLEDSKNGITCKARINTFLNYLQDNYVWYKKVTK
jgi:hypothetical protein